VWRRVAAAHDHSQLPLYSFVVFLAPSAMP
jgi:hypothetical protein